MNLNFLDFEIFALPETEQQISRLVGKNGRNVFILYESDGQEEALQSYLTKILSSVQLNFPDDILLLPLNKGGSLSLQPIIKSFNITVFISFGLLPERLGLNFEPLAYQPIHHKDQIYLFVDPLKAIWEERQQKDRKMAGMLWQALKSIFSN